MPRITISYRRDDSGVIAGRIFDRLVARYGREAIFRDIDDVPFGVDFRTHIDEVLASTDVVIAIVGPNWAGPSASQSRLSNEADPVRVEIETTLRRKVPLIPVLVLGATMPTITQLPESLKDFAYRNAIQLDAGQDFDVHMARLLRAIDGILGRAAEAARPLRDKTSAPRAEATPPRKRRDILIAGGAGVVLAAALIVAWLHFGVDRQISPAPGDNRVVATNPPVAAPTPSPPQASAAAPQTPAAPTPNPENVFWENAKTAADFEEYLRKYPNGKFGDLAQNHLAALRAPPPAPSPNPEIVFWQSIQSSKTAADFEEYLRKFPSGQFVGLARNRVAVLRPPPSVIQPPPTPAISAAEAFRKGKDAERDNPTEALRWYRKAADQGHAEAQLNVGIIYEHGIGVAPDRTEALRWYRKAAEKGNSDAGNYIGTMYQLGNGVAQDYQEAMRWYRDAAARGNPNAYYSIGMMYKHGHGVPRDLAQARVWLNKAAAAGVSDPHE